MADYLSKETRQVVRKAGMSAETTIANLITLCGCRKTIEIEWPPPPYVRVPISKPMKVSDPIPSPTDSGNMWRAFSLEEVNSWLHVATYKEMWPER